MQKLPSPVSAGMVVRLAGRCAPRQGGLLDAKNFDGEVAFARNVGRHVHGPVHARRIVATQLQLCNRVVAHMWKVLQQGARGRRGGQPAAHEAEGTARHEARAAGLGVVAVIAVGEGEQERHGEILLKSVAAGRERKH